ncbi:MAG TPA: amidohydrolase/deacetylase family metallohydrolase [Bryobacteraceae bacterium]|nr:amidohydrolase/deacetylase family metallohydrolase [Bryobacteraceae bacterium]
MPFDLLLTGAQVIDPAQSLNQRADVGITAGRIAQVGPTLDPAGCPDVRDVAGKYVCPGLIDLHGHWYEGNLYGVDPLMCLNHGVTTAVDAGSTGYANFPEFRRTVLDRCLTDVLAFVHISFMGLHAPFAEELVDLRYARPAETAAVLAKHPDRAVGVKLRIGAMTANHGLAALDQALSAARDARVPLMVHISRGAEESEILRRLRPGDILTHCFHGRGNGMISEAVLPEALEARSRGVIFDVGHGCGSFSWDTARKAFEHHFYPDTISTDLHRYSAPEPLCVSLPQVMSQMLCLGMKLEDVVLKTTAIPARVLNRERQIGTLAPGAQADALVFELESGNFSFTDTHMKVRQGNKRIVPHLTIKAGQVHHAGSIPIKLRDLYESDMDVFRAIG